MSPNDPDISDLSNPVQRPGRGFTLEPHGDGRQAAFIRPGGSARSVLYFAFVCSTPRAAGATTYLVGPGRTYADLSAVAPVLAPGDRVEVDGGTTYPGGVIFRASGTAQAKITVVGRR